MASSGRDLYKARTLHLHIATSWAAASWLFFRPAARRTRSSRINLDMLVATASPARTALKNSQLTRRPPGERHAYFGDRTLGSDPSTPRDFRRGFYDLAEGIL
jgi:hypothetical protein